MRIVGFLMIIQFGLLGQFCSKRQEITNGERYCIVGNYADSTNRIPRASFDERIDGNILYLFFEEGFDSDTITIRKNNEREIRTLHLRSDAFGLSDYTEYGCMQSIKAIEIRKNNGDPMTIEIREGWMNKWAINFRSDTLIAQVLKHAPYYE
jgi:hypothetical protein